MKIFLLFASVIGGLVYYTAALLRQPADPSMKEFHAAFVIDNSTSQTIDCETLPAMMQAEIKDVEHPTKSSTVRLFRLGDDVSSYEPVPIWTGNMPHRTASNFGGTDFAGDVKHACGQITAVPASSIYRAVKIVLEDLNAHKRSRSDASYKLIVKTDMEETVSRRFFQGTQLAHSLPNQDINVVICGYASTASQAGPRERLVEELIGKWKTAFAEAPVFKPFCEGSSAMQIVSSR